jgi:fibronectin type 3 domain-containing protein
MRQLLLEIDGILPSIRFQKINGPPNAETYDGETDGWRILVVAFPIGENDLRGVKWSKNQTPQKITAQTHRGFDGTATKMEKLTVIRLTPELAKKAVTLAEAQVMS